LPTSWTRDPDSAAVEIERRILTKQQAAHYIGRSDNEHVEARQREDVSQLAAPPANRQWNEGEVCAVARQVRDRQCHAVATLQADGRARTELLLQEPRSEVDAALPQLGVGEPFVLVGDGQHVWSARRGLVEGVVERTFDPCTCAGEAGDVFRSQRLDRHGVTFCRRSG
jgi:hypothetical protein